MTRAHRLTHPAAAAALVWILLGLAACDEQERIINGPTPIPPQLVSVTLASDTIVAGTTVQGTVAFGGCAFRRRVCLAVEQPRRRGDGSRQCRRT